jgi:Ran GTPase-activating protein (RanGAP) involved in mRNA processing and transport
MEGDTDAQVAEVAPEGEAAAEAQPPVAEADEATEAEPPAAEEVEAETAQPPVAEEVGDEGNLAAQESAATRIQAVQRGKAARRETAARRGGAQSTTGAAEEEEGAAEVEAPMPEEDASPPQVPPAEEGLLPRSDTALLPPESDGLGAYFEGQGLAAAYASAAQAAGRKVNYLVHRSLAESQEAGLDTFFVEAPGSHKLVFSSRLGDDDVPVLLQTLSGHAAFLARLDLSCNLFTDAGIEQLSRGLLGSRAKSLREVSVRANSIGPRGCEALCQAIRGCPGLQSLDVSQNPLGRAGGLSIVDLLQGSQSLLDLRLADTEIDINVLVAISTALMTNRPMLELCNLENPRLSTLQEDHTVHIGRMLRVNTHVQAIYLGKHKIRDDGVRQLVSFLLENKTLQVLDLRCNELGAEGAKHLSKFLASDCQLVSLNLAGNRIGERANVDGVRAIGESLLINRRLRYLDLNCNLLCGQALELLGEALEQNTTLEALAVVTSEWDQHASFKFHQVLNDRSRQPPLCCDFVTKEVDLRIDICKVEDWRRPDLFFGA